MTKFAAVLDLTILDLGTVKQYKAVSRYLAKAGCAPNVRYQSLGGIRGSVPVVTYGSEGQPCPGRRFRCTLAEFTQMDAWVRALTLS